VDATAELAMARESAQKEKFHFVHGKTNQSIERQGWSNDVALYYKRLFILYSCIYQSQYHFP
jgi:hypothetical protein